MTSHCFCVTTLAGALVLAGCEAVAPEKKSSQERTEASQFEKPSNLSQHVRNNTASLLYDLLNNEKNLSKILIVKRESDSLHDLVKRISTTASDRAKELEQLAASDFSLNLHVMGLPSGEAATREAISKTKEHELLHSKGDAFEFKLLLTQTEALNYGAHLAKVAAANDTNSMNAQVFTGIQNDLQTLYQEVCNQLQHRQPDKVLEQKPK